MTGVRSFDDAFLPSLRTLGDDDALREFLQSTADLHRLTVAIDEPDGKSFVLAGEASTPNPMAPTSWVGDPIVYDGVNIGLLRVGHGPDRSEAEVERILAHVRLVLDLLLHHGHRSAVAAALQEATMREHVRQVTIQNEELRAAYEHVRQLDRLKIDFLGTVSHELRTPLTSILGYGEMLVQGVAGELQTEQREFVQTIREKGEHLLQLINGMLDTAKLESGTLEVHRAQLLLPPLLESVAATFVPHARRRTQRLELDVGTDVLEVFGDGVRLRQVFMNLVDNALKFSPKGETVRLEARLVVSALYDGQPIGDDELSPTVAYDAVEVRVRDRGPGIPLDEHGRIFDPFYQVDSSQTRKHQGAGLGLAICKRLVEAHDGRIVVEANDPQGTCFVVTLPIAPPDRERRTRLRGSLRP
jgi:two-component system, NarL family, sensor histidine kinase BarA